MTGNKGANEDAAFGFGFGFGFGFVRKGYVEGLCSAKLHVDQTLYKRCFRVHR